MLIDIIIFYKHNTQTLVSSQKNKKDIKLRIYQQQGRPQ